jgi:hypothetical protein
MTKGVDTGSIIFRTQHLVDLAGCGLVMSGDGVEELHGWYDGRMAARMA